MIQKIRASSFLSGFAGGLLALVLFGGIPKVWAAVQNNTVTTAATTTPTDIFVGGCNTTGTPAAGYGCRMTLRGQDASKTAGGDDLAAIGGALLTATSGAEDTRLNFYTRTAGATKAIVGAFEKGNFAIGTHAPGAFFHVQSGPAGVVGGIIENTSANAASYANFSVLASAGGATDQIGLQKRSSGWASTTYGENNADLALIFNQTAGSLIVGNIAAKPVVVIANNTRVSSFESNTDIVMGVKAAKAIGDTTGHLYIPSSAGKPTGAPAGYTGMTASQYDTTNNQVCFYNGSWRCIAVL